MEGLGIIWSIIIGVAAGAIAGWLMRGHGFGFIVNLIVGLVGSILGGWVTSLLLGVDLTSGVNLTTIIVSILGAMLVIFIYRLIKRK